MNMTAHDGTHLMMFVSFLCLECRGGFFLLLLSDATLCLLISNCLFLDNVWV